MNSYSRPSSSCNFTEDITLDARRRDFTCNAVYYCVQSKTFCDPLGGISDIENKTLRTVRESRRVFGEDGLRLLRLAHQGGQLGFTPNEETERVAKVRVHEYGHCIQSIVLGPLYLIVGLISVTWANLPYFRKLRREKKVPYTACFAESWASKWGEWVTGEEAIWN